MARLAISLLGTFHATVGERSVSFRSDTERALLAYLAVELDRAHSRETLAALLWPDREEETDRKSVV